jgi:hypothetical protein
MSAEDVEQVAKLAAYEACDLMFASIVRPRSPFRTAGECTREAVRRALDHYRAGTVEAAIDDHEFDPDEATEERFYR